MLTFRLLLLMKLAAVMTYAGGLMAATIGTVLAERRRAVHAIATPALAVIWFAGYLLAGRIFVPLSSAWILAGWGLSFVSLIALITSVTRETRRTAAIVVAHGSFWAVLPLMVFRPSW